MTDIVLVIQDEDPKRLVLRVGWLIEKKVVGWESKVIRLTGMSAARQQEELDDQNDGEWELVNIIPQDGEILAYFHKKYEA